MFAVATTSTATNATSPEILFRYTDNSNRWIPLENGRTTSPRWSTWRTKLIPWRLHALLWGIRFVVTRTLLLPLYLLPLPTAAGTPPPPLPPTGLLFQVLQYDTSSSSLSSSTSWTKVGSNVTIDRLDVRDDHDDGNSSSNIDHDTFPIISFSGDGSYGTTTN